MIKREAKGDGGKALAVLRKYYLRESDQRLYALLMSFFTKRLENGGSAMEYLSFLEETVAALREAGESISDRILVVITLKGLPQRY